MRPLFQKLANFLWIAKISLILKEAEVLPRRLSNFGKPNNFVFSTIQLSYFFKHVWITLRRYNNFGQLVQFLSFYGGTMTFYPVHLTLFTVISVETRYMSGVFIQILMTCHFDLVTSNNLKSMLQQDNRLRSQVVQETTQTPANRAKTARPIKRRKSRIAGERRVKNMQRREKSAKS